MSKNARGGGGYKCVLTTAGQVLVVFLIIRVNVTCVLTPCCLQVQCIGRGNKSGKVNLSKDVVTGDTVKAQMKQTNAVDRNKPVRQHQDYRVLVESKIGTANHRNVGGRLHVTGPYKLWEKMSELDDKIIRYVCMVGMNLSESDKR